MVKSKKRARRRRFNRFRRYSIKDKRIPLLTVLPIAHKAIIEPIFGDGGEIYGAKKRFDEGNPTAAAIEFVDVIGINFLGYKFSDGSSWWSGHSHSPINTYAELGLGILGSKLASKFGVNKQIRKIPFAGKYIKL